MVRPSEADEPTAEGAAAFARYWYAELDRAYAALDNSNLVAISEPGCKTCQNYINDVAATRIDGTKIEGGSVRISTAEAPAIVEGLTTVLIQFDRDSITVYNREGTVTRTFPAVRRGVLQFQARLANGEWRAARVIEPST